MTTSRLSTARLLTTLLLATAMLLTTACLLLAAGPARAAVWVIPASARAFPNTQPGRAQIVALDAAGNEYEGAQVVVRGAAARDVRVGWATGGEQKEARGQEHRRQERGCQEPCCG